MMISQIRLCFVLICLFFCTAKLKSQTVYITETGKKYHVKNCAFVKNYKKEMQLKEAKKKGYKPCTICGTDKIAEKEEKPAIKKK